MDPEKGDPADAIRRGEPRGVARTVQRIYKEQGLAGFWGGELIHQRIWPPTSHFLMSPGFSTTIPLSLNPAITLFLFQAYSKLTPRGKQTKLGTPSAKSAFVGSALSNVVATWLLYPLMLAKTRLQVSRKRAKEADANSKEAKESSEASMLTIWEDAMRKEGAYGLYQGLEAQLLKGFVSQGVTMVVKQR